jgi:hypothetical protein
VKRSSKGMPRLCTARGELLPRIDADIDSAAKLRCARKHMPSAAQRNAQSGASVSAGATSFSSIPLLHLRVLRLGLLEDGDVGVGVFPEGEEVSMPSLLRQPDSAHQLSKPWVRT